MTTLAVARTARSLGADLCGIAPLSRFSHAPPGFRPTDIFPRCKSAIVFAKRLAPALLDAATLVPYRFANESERFRALDSLAVELCNRLFDRGIDAVPIPSDVPYEHWEPERKHGRGILSIKHAAVLAGLGVMGKNTLLITPKFGNMVNLGAVLTDADLAPTSLVGEALCPEGCRRCLDACPARALDGTTVDQKRCRETAYRTNARGFELTDCAACRRACPSRAWGRATTSGSRRTRRIRST